jgi:hypothetical protein
MNAKLTDADVFVLVTALLNKMDHPHTATVRSEVAILKVAHCRRCEMTQLFVSYFFYP